MDYRLLERTIGQGEETDTLFGAAAAALEDVTSGRRALRAVHHPLGFFCLPVLRDGDQGICVHVFEPGESEPVQLTTSPVHCHSWELTSFVLYGEVGNLQTRVRQDPVRPTHRVFQVHSSPSGVDEIRPTSRLVRCEPGPEQTSARGQVYRLPAGAFHSTVVPSGSHAATLVLGHWLPQQSDLSLGPVEATAHRVVRQTCDAAQTARTARSALRRIHGYHPQ
ncbi:hypothetical protein SAMN05428945_5178 [Streptomyces sp. 2224.1]|nr:hypothetical protein [Streptomyces sp. KS_16]PBC80333.1 hypothetical protein BX261_0156 [Streptomyces sp. 2321.6]SEB70747.1 hypothetical protein SAMN05428940_0156 [Streptomyces sp. 2133.1]SED52941.1 hypothetical protein SAMN05428945_5178 [Streptomyces sp. 2224.1]SEF17938.1 hypothetical protein SAMN05428954_7119 [Streptomyces sp. 2112.3]SNC59901.1 hypothetical protein SAMN06272741_0158 [Streptomyces sp. 2114.4]